MYNVVFDDGYGTLKTYLSYNVPTREQAEEYLKAFKDRYVDKRYPNGKGYYPCHSPRVVEM